MAVSELPGNPNAVWTVKRNTEGDHILLFEEFLCRYRLFLVCAILPTVLWCCCLGNGNGIV